MTTEHLSDILVQVRRSLGGVSRITKVVVLEVRVIRELIEEALETNVRGPRAQFLLLNAIYEPVKVYRYVRTSVSVYSSYISYLC